MQLFNQIAQSHSTSSGYARSILRIATGEQFPLSMPKRKRRIVRKEEETYPLEPQQRQLNITTEQLHNGIYIATLLDREGQILKKAKLAILK